MLATLLNVGIAVSSGWRLLHQLELPRRDAAGQPIGGFSAVSYRSQADEIWLLSDLPNGGISIWSGLAREQPPRLMFELPLGKPEPGDGDGTPTLLLVSDDNLNPLQASRLALLAAERGSTCTPWPR